VLIFLGLYGVHPVQQILQSVLDAEGLLIIILFALAYTAPWVAVSWNFLIINQHLTFALGKIGQSRCLCPSISTSTIPTKCFSTVTMLFTLKSSSE
jgi:hypothetical protein